MKLFKTLTTSVLALTMVFSLAACAKKTTSVDTISSAKKVITESTSYNATMGIDVAMSSEEQEESFKAMNEVAKFEKPLLLKMEMTATQGTGEGTKSIMYIEEKDNVFTTYMDDTANHWIKEEIEKETIDDALKQYNVKDRVIEYMEKGKEFKETAKEDINGVKTTKFDGKILAADVQSILEASGALDFLMLSGLKEQHFKDISDLNVTIWVSESDNFPVKYIVDFAPAIQKIMDNLALGYEGTEVLPKLTIGKYIIDVVFSNSGKVEKFEIPEEARSAVDYKDVAPQTMPLPEETQLPEIPAEQ